jgi:hypothetical protein
MKIFTEDGEEHEIDPAVLNGGNGDEDARAELARVKSELERSNAAIQRLASRPGMSLDDEPSPSEQGFEAAKEAKAAGKPADEIMASFVGVVTEATVRRQAAKAEARAVAERADKLERDLAELRGDIQEG